MIEVKLEFAVSLLSLFRFLLAPGVRLAAPFGRAGAAVIRAFRPFLLLVRGGKSFSRALIIVVLGDSIVTFSVFRNFVDTTMVQKKIQKTVILFGFYLACLVVVTTFAPSFPPLTKRWKAFSFLGGAMLHLHIK